MANSASWCVRLDQYSKSKKVVRASNIVAVLLCSGVLRGILLFLVCTIGVFIPFFSHLLVDKSPPLASESVFCRLLFFHAILLLNTLVSLALAHAGNDLKPLSGYNRALVLLVGFMLNCFLVLALHWMWPNEVLAEPFYNLLSATIMTAAAWALVSVVSFLPFPAVRLPGENEFINLHGCIDVPVKYVIPDGARCVDLSSTHVQEVIVPSSVQSLNVHDCSELWSLIITHSETESSQLSRLYCRNTQLKLLTVPPGLCQLYASGNLGLTIKFAEKE